MINFIQLKGIIHILALLVPLLLTSIPGTAQNPVPDSTESNIYLPGLPEGYILDSNRQKFHLQSFGLSFRDGTTQFFESYNYEVLLANAREGLPIFLDWPDYSGVVLLPEYHQFAGHAAWVDTIRGLKLRAGLTYLQRKDSMATTADFTRNDTIFGRNASEFARYYGITVGGMKMSRKLFNTVRLYGGAEIEMVVAPRSDIYFLLFAYDIGEQSIVDFNEFRVEGKARANFYGSALLGLETVFFKHIGFFFEVKSGLGMQVVMREKTFGLAKNAYHIGLNYYLWDYKRKQLPKLIMEPTEEELRDMDE